MSERHCLLSKDNQQTVHSRMSTMSRSPLKFSRALSVPHLPIELLNINSHGLSPPGGLVSPSGGFV